MGLFTIQQFLKYQIAAVNAHGLHSPFLYELYRKVIRNRDCELLKNINHIRNTIVRSDLEFNYTDPRTGILRSETIGRWSKRVCSSSRFSAFLVLLINHLKINTMLETGTAAGINACAIALSNAKRIITMEGSLEIANVAEQTIKDFGQEKVILRRGNVQDHFETVIDQYKPELIFLDADHRSETIQFYLQAISKMNNPPKCIVVHDIYWSRDMAKAWEEIIANTKYSLTVDLFQAGLIFPNYPTEKQHFTIRF